MQRMKRENQDGITLQEVKTSPLHNIAGQKEGKSLGCFYTLELPLQDNFMLFAALVVQY